MCVSETAFPTDGCALHVVGAGAFITGLIPGGWWRSWRIEHWTWCMLSINRDVLRIARLVMIETADLPSSPFVINISAHIANINAIPNLVSTKGTRANRATCGISGLPALFTNAAPRREVVVNTDCVPRPAFRATCCIICFPGHVFNEFHCRGDSFSGR